MERKKLYEERRYLAQPVRRSAAEPRTIEGHAAVFNVLSEDLGGFKERVLSGAFIDAVLEDVRALINHNPDKLIGRTKNGSLRLQEDEVGLKFRCALPDTSYANDLLESIRRQDMTQCSFSFVALDDDWAEEEDPETRARIPVRSLKKVGLIDISPVTMPAYPQTHVQLARAGFPGGMAPEMRSRIRSHRYINRNLADFRRKIFNLIVG